MKILAGQLINLPVASKNGQSLGRISDLEIDVDSHQVVIYRVCADWSIKNLFKKNILLITSRQVVSIDDKKMIVQDNAVADPVVVTLGDQPILNAEID